MWTPEEQIKSMQPAVLKLVAQLEKQGIHFVTGKASIFDDTVTDNNVIFSKGHHLVAISYHSFYRFSGIAVIIRDRKGENNQSEAVPVTDDMYMQTFMKPIIETLLSI